MTVALRPLEEEEFDAWRDHHVEWYAADLLDNGGMPSDAAERKARSHMDQVPSARERGLPRVDLSVFAGNAPARSLYRSLGFEEAAVHMGKDIT